MSRFHLDVWKYVYDSLTRVIFSMVPGLEYNKTCFYKIDIVIPYPIILGVLDLKTTILID